MNKKTRTTIKHLSRILLFLPVFLFCNKSVIKTSAGNLSRGSLEYLLASFFQEDLIGRKKTKEDIKDTEKNDFSNLAGKVKSPDKLAQERILNRIKDLYAAGLVATRYGFKEHQSYDQYVFFHKRSREGMASSVYFSRNLRTDESQNDYRAKLDLLKIKLSPKEINEILERNVIREGAIVKTKDSMNDIVIGRNDGKPIYLAHISRYTTVEEYTRLLAFKKEARPAAIVEAIAAYVDYFAQLKLLEDIGANESQLQVFDHNRSAEMYLSKRFGKAEKGIFPTMSLELKFSSTELYDHYLKILPTLNHINSIFVKGAIFKEKAQAIDFHQKLRLNKTIEQLCKENRNYKSCGTAYHITGYDNFLDKAERENRSAFENWLLESAFRSNNVPSLLFWKNHWYAARIEKINYAEKNPSFEKYSWKVKHDLNEKSLHALLKSEMKTAIKEMDFQVDNSVFQEIYYKLASKKKR